jgi:hypothetical protein
MQKEVFFELKEVSKKVIEDHGDKVGGAVHVGRIQFP